MFPKLLPPDSSFTSWAPSSLSLTCPFSRLFFSQRCTFNWSVNKHKEQQSCSDVDEQWRRKRTLLSECRGADEGVEGGFSNQRTTSWWKTSGGAERRKWHREVRSEGGRWEDPAVGRGSALTCRSAPRSDPWRVAWVQQRLGRMFVDKSKFYASLHKTQLLYSSIKLVSN